MLLDEAGAGTDPIEGGALAMAMIDHFRKRGAMVVATTHYDSLKTYAATTEGVVPAGFGFDPQTFAPTYRLNYGSPGSSLALEIATRLGMPAAIIEQARAHRSERESQLAEHLARVESDLQALEHEHRLAARERQTLEETAAKLQAREQELRNREETFRRRLDEQIEERLRDARREIDAVVEGLKARTDALAAEAERRAAPRLIPTGQTGAARGEARAASTRSVRSSAPRTHRSGPRVVGRRTARAVGDRVIVGALGLEGIVQAVHDGSAEVDVRGKRLRAKIDDLRVITAAAACGAPARVRVNVDLQPRSGVVDRTESDRQQRRRGIDPAREVPRRVADHRSKNAADRSRLRHGSAAPRGQRVSEDASARGALRPGARNQGAGGATVVELKE